MFLGSYAPPVKRPRSYRNLLRTVLGMGVLAMLVATAIPAHAINCLTQEMRMRLPEDLSELAALPPTHQPGDRMAPPPDPQVGDFWDWYLWYFVGGPPHYILSTCTVRGLGDNVYVVVRDADWNVWVDQADVDLIVANWDNSSYGNWPSQGIYPLNTNNFGLPPDRLDNDPRVYVVLYDWDTSLADGYWNVGDEFADNLPSNPSNECECLYVDASTSHPGGPSGAYLTAVMAHEFEHMIHWNGDSNEVAWVDEGLAELAMWFYGNPDQISGFNSNPDNNLTNFSTTADYIKTYLWSLYLYEHFGGTPTIRALVANPLNTIEGVQSTLAAMGYTETVAEVVRDWATANYLDDPNIAGGKYNYAGEDLPAFAAVTKTTYPVAPVNTTLNHWAGEYVKFINGQPQQLYFDGGDGVNWYARAVKYLAGTPLSVEDVVLDGAAAGDFSLSGFGTDYDQVVMVVVDGSPVGSTVYQYSTDQVPTGVDEVLASGGIRLRGAGQNPFAKSTAVMMDLPRAARIQATIHDASGARVKTLTLGAMEAGSHLLRWDGRNDAGAPLPSGVYFLHVGTDGGAKLGYRLVKLK